jgi:magnesium transporter
MADAAALTFAFMRSHPAQAAQVLEAASISESVQLFSRVPVRIGSDTLAEMLPRIAARTLLALPDERAIELLSHLHSQPAVAILRHIGAPDRSRFIAGLPTAAALAAKLLLEYVDDSVGSCVDPDVIAMPAGTRADEALERVRNADARVDRVFAVEVDRRLLGWVPLDALMRAPQDALLETLLLPAPALLAAHAPLAGARAHPGWQTASTLPVVDRGNRLIGVLTRDALARTSQRQGREPAADDSLAGVLISGYWQSISALLEGLTSCLPASRPRAWSDDER